MTRLPVLLLVLVACGVDPAATLPDAGSADAGEDLVCTPRVKLPADCKYEACPTGYVCAVDAFLTHGDCKPRCETTWTSACAIATDWGGPSWVDGHRKEWRCEESPGVLRDPPKLVTEGCGGGSGSLCVHLPGAAEGDDWRPWHSNESPCLIWNWGPEHWPFRFP